MLFRILFFAIPIFFIYLFINEYLKQRRAAEENWKNQWEEKKKNFYKEQELKEKDREIQKLKQKLEEEKHRETKDKIKPEDFSSN